MKKAISSDYFLFTQKALQCDSCDSCDSFQRRGYIASLQLSNYKYIYLNYYIYIYIYNKLLNKDKSEGSEKN